MALCCCDLTRPALAAGQRASFRAAVLDPDWSPAGRPASVWAERLADMRPPADELLRWARGMAPLVVCRLPAALAGRVGARWVLGPPGGRDFAFAFWGE